MGTVLGLAAPSPAGVPSPQRLGYSNVVLERLAQHARAALGFREAWIVVAPAGRAGEFVAVAGAGVDPDLIGRRLQRPGTGRGGLRPGAERIRGPRGPLRRRQGRAAKARTWRNAAAAGARHVRRGGPLTSRSPRARGRRLAGRDPRAREGARGGGRRHLPALARGRRHRDGPRETPRAGPRGACRGRARCPASRRRQAAPATAQLLTKPGPLTEEELRLVRLHPEWGADMVARIPGLEAVALIVRLHHERPDGLAIPTAWRTTESRWPRGSSRSATPTAR